jgi:hypothetical protein
MSEGWSHKQPAAPLTVEGLRLRLPDSPDVDALVRFGDDLDTAGFDELDARQVELRIGVTSVAPSALQRRRDTRGAASNGRASPGEESDDLLYVRNAQVRSLWLGDLNDPHVSHDWGLLRPC